MTYGVKCSENYRWTFWGRDWTPGLGVGAMVMEVAACEILTCVYGGVSSSRKGWEDIQANL